MTDTRTTDDTRNRILDAAEPLFMENGYDATSMRHITSAAGVNLAAVNYHFGNKEALMQAVLKRRLAVINRERLRVLDALEAAAAGQPLKPSAIVDAFFGTLLRMGTDPAHGGATFMRLLGRTHTEPAGFLRTLFSEEYDEVVRRYKVALFRALPEVPKNEIVWRFHFMLGATSYAIAGTDVLRLLTDWPEEQGESTDRPEYLLPRLMSFLIGGLRAPLPQFGDPSPPGA